MKRLAIQSIADIITNSSSEVFVFKMNEDFSTFMKEFSWARDVKMFKTWEDLKRYLMSDDCRNDDALSEIYDWPGEFGDIFSFYAIVDKMMQYRSEDEIFEFFKPIFDGIIGKAIMSFDNNYIDEVNLAIAEANAKISKKGFKTTKVHESHGY